MEHIQCINVDPQTIGLNVSDIKNMLPAWKTKIMEIYRYKNGSGYELSLLIAAKTESEAKQWLQEYEELSKCSYSIRSTQNCSGIRVKFKQSLNCNHNTGSSSTYSPSKRKRTRNTNCPSSINITLRTINKRYQGKDKSKAPDPEFPCEIRLNPVHNHSVRSADALRFRAVTNETREHLLNLFKSAHSPATALESLKMDVQLKYDNFHEILADRAVCPDYMYCYHLFIGHFKEKYGPLKTTKEYLEKRIEGYNQANENSARIKFIGDDYVISLCPLLMKRIHVQIENAADIVFIDSTGTVDHDGNRIFILSTTSECGGLPLGIIISSSESTNLISTGFQLLQNIVGNIIFGGNVEGPSIFMTDDSLSEQIAIQTVWPRSKRLLCIFHVLQSVWRWLIKSKHGIRQNDQQVLFQQFRTIMYANNLSECEESYEIALETSKMYPLYCEYLQKYWEHKDMWTLCSRSYLRRGHNTNNISEAAMRLLKEKIFERIKAFNLVQTIDFMLTKFVYYYERRLLDAAHNRTRKNILHLEIRIPPPNLVEKIQHVTNHVHLVPSESTVQLFYCVNTEVLTCTCHQGRAGYVCKHIYWVCLFVRSEAFIKKIDDETIRRKFYFIATGNQPPSDWLKPLFGGHTISPVNNEFLVNSLETTHNSNNLICNSNSEPEVDKEQLVEKGTSIVKDISDCFIEYLNRSPTEVFKALNVLNDRLKEIKTVAAFSTACHTFSGLSRKHRGSKIPVQPTAISRRKTLLSGKRSSVGGRPRKGSVKKNCRSRKPFPSSNNQ